MESEGDYFSGKGGNLRLQCATLSFQLNQFTKKIKDSVQLHLKTQDLISKHLIEIQENANPISIFPYLSNMQSFNGKISETFGTDKFVVLHFFTYCCANCLCVLPQLHLLEKGIHPNVELLSIHGAKFPNEKINKNIQNAISKYNVKHLVVNDEKKELYSLFGVSSWPTFVLLSPKSIFLYQMTGEEAFHQIMQIIETHSNKIFEVPSKFEFEDKNISQNTELHFPSGISVDRIKNRIFVSDSGNNRILVLSSNGTILKQIGSGRKGFVDGNFESAEFNFPQGLRYDFVSNSLFVCDTYNHAIRKINLEENKIETIVGNGKRGTDLSGGKIGSEQTLALPWDLEIDSNNREIYVAMAALHQIWKIEIQTNKAHRYCGSGIEAHRNSNNPKVAGLNIDQRKSLIEKKAFAQPSSICFGSNKELFVADAESSTIRCISSEGTKTIVGGDWSNYFNLVAFGDKDGIGEEAKLQHPLAVKFIPELNKLFVLDSYNHKIKCINIETSEIKSIGGISSPGYKDGKLEEAELNEPSALDYIIENGNIILLIADTNNHLIRCSDLKEVNTLQIKK